MFLFNVPPIAHTNMFTQFPKRWANETEQPSPPLRSPKVGELLSKIWDAACIYWEIRCDWSIQIQDSQNRCSDADRLSSRVAAARWRGGEGCSLPAAYQSGRSTVSNISGNCWDLFINVLRVIWIFTLYWGRRSSPHLWVRLDRPHCISKLFEGFSISVCIK